MTKIFITGASGFLGTAVAKRLREKKWQVRGLAHSKQAGWVSGDIRKDSWHPNVLDSEVFVYLAGVHGFIQMPFGQRVLQELEGAQSAVLAAKRAKVKHFIYVSTAYTDQPTDYARAKSIAKRYLEQEIKNGFPATIICPVSVYGPGKDRNFGRLYAAIRNGRFAFVGDGQNRIDIIYIDDFVGATLAVINNFSKTVGKTYVISTDEKISWNSLVTLIARNLNVAEPRLYLPKVPMLILGQAFAGLSSLGFPVPFQADTVMTMLSNRHYSTSRELVELGFRPKVKLEEGLRRTFK